MKTSILLNEISLSNNKLNNGCGGSIHRNRVIAKYYLVIQYLHYFRIWFYQSVQTLFKTSVLYKD